jgi:hypothetical protein
MTPVAKEDVMEKEEQKVVDDDAHRHEQRDAALRALREAMDAGLVTPEDLLDELERSRSSVFRCCDCTVI